MDLSIGELARRAGVSVKSVRYYSDLGLLVSRRTSSGHRRYDATALARLELIRTLRALGIDLPTVRAVLDQERSLADVATAHAEALAVQIRTLRLRHAVLTVAARRHTPEELELMNTLIADFLSSTLGDDPDLAAVRQNLTPVLPDDASAVQMEAWLELAALAQDEDFRAEVRRLAAGYRGITVLQLDPAQRDKLIRLRDQADPRWHRYQELLAVINGWAPPSRMAG